MPEIASSARSFCRETLARRSAAAAIFAASRSAVASSAAASLAAEMFTSVESAMENSKRADVRRLPLFFPRNHDSILPKAGAFFRLAQKRCSPLAEKLTQTPAINDSQHAHVASRHDGIGLF